MCGGDRAVLGDGVHGVEDEIGEQLAQLGFVAR